METSPKLSLSLGLAQPLAWQQLRRILHPNEMFTPFPPMLTDVNLTFLALQLPIFWLRPAE